MAKVNKYGLLLGSILLGIITMSLARKIRRGLVRKLPSQEQLQKISKNKGMASAVPPGTVKEKLPQQAINLVHRWRCVGASVRGTRHVLSRSPCQDYHCFEQLPTGELIVAVADGAGSSSQSEIGARLACAAAVEKLKLTLSGQKLKTDEAWQLAIQAAFTAALASLSSEAQQKKISVSEFATTLIVMVFTQNLVVGGMVGDGTGVVKDAAGNLACIFTPQKGEYANQAYFLTTPHALSIAG